MLANLTNQFITKKNIRNHLYYFKILAETKALFNDHFLGIFNGSGLIYLIRYMDGVKTSDSDFEILLDFIINACKTSMILEPLTFR